MAGEDVLTISEIEKELERMNETLQIVINGYDAISREFWEFISTDPELEQRYGEFAQKRRNENSSEITVPVKQEEKRFALESPAPYIR